MRVIIISCPRNKNMTALARRPARSIIIIIIKISSGGRCIKRVNRKNGRNIKKKKKKMVHI